MADVVFTFLRTGEEVLWRAEPSAVTEAGTRLREAVASWGRAVTAEDFGKTAQVQRCVRCGYRGVCRR